ncbi:MAG: lipopolysaccharide biosynthesis protein RfbH [Syntrophomonadaceae bacterium]|jgi:CDP-6-deoxy-D-xylo-4-hexulose-3-dehydrase|nr:lipopolysaccharide biosynthesis protein RfbH [Syntrophomonadaceae bacterium]
MDSLENKLRQDVIAASVKYYDFKYRHKSDFSPGDRIGYAGRVFDEHELTNLVESALDFWLTSGKYTETFEKQLSEYLGVKYCSLVNSGSSANLLAFSALTSPQMGDRRILPGDEIITIAAGFPTTVTPIIQYGAIPVFVDIDIPGYNINYSMLDEALSSRTKAIMVAHTLGNPFNLQYVKDFCDKNGLWLIEDNCDALGAEYFYNGEWKHTGTIGDLGTSSFYPPHHITMGEGGAVYTDNPLLKRLVESFRDWGRDCWCPPGKDNTCKKRFEKQWGELPLGYDHKYVYSHFGYNLKVTDMQSAVGCAQLEKLPGFIVKRNQNWQAFRHELDSLSDVFILPEPTAESQPSWFGFMLTVRENAGFSRDNIVQYLESKGIQTRMLFAGNLIKHPCFNEMRMTGKGYRVISSLKNTDIVMNQSFWIGVYPGLNNDMISYIIQTIREFVAK